jgi:hypothetical protein
MKEFSIDVAQTQILDDGNLKKGYYWYRVAAVLDGVELVLANTLMAWAPHRGNTVSLYWDDVPGAEAYRVYRRSEDGREGSILVPAPAFFHDNGLIEFE